MHRPGGEGELHLAGADDLTRQFNTAAFSGPKPGSLGLESGLNYMRGCPDHTFDFAIARNIQLGGNRQLQLRAELYNAFDSVIITGRNTTMNIASLETASVATNLPTIPQAICFRPGPFRARQDSAWRRARRIRVECSCRFASSSELSAVSYQKIVGQ